MKAIDEQRLESDLHYRYGYLCEFIGFTDMDIALIHGLASRLQPRLGEMVESTYDKLLSFTATARHFLPRQHGFDGPLPERLEALGHDTAQIQFRKEHLRRYLLSLLGNAYDARMVQYLDIVGKIHTPKAGNKAIDVPLVQMNALMGVLSDVLTRTIFEMELGRDEERATLRAVGKLLWIQNDLINRHYAAEPTNGHVSLPPSPAASAWK